MHKNIGIQIHTSLVPLHLMCHSQHKYSLDHVILGRWHCLCHQTDDRHYGYFPSDHTSITLIAELSNK